MAIYSIRAAATRASMPPETRLAMPALVVGTALWDAGVELAAPEELALPLALALAEVDFAEDSVEEAEVLVAVLVAVLEAVVKVVGELVVAEEVEVDFSEVVVWVVEVDDSVDD